MASSVFPHFHQSFIYEFRYKNIAVYPVSNGTLLNVVVVRHQRHLMGTSYDPPFPVQVDNAELMSLAEFSEWEPEIQAWLRVSALSRILIEVCPH